MLKQDFLRNYRLHFSLKLTNNFTRSALMIGLGIGFLGSPVSAQDNDDRLNPLFSCSEIEDTLERLQCYDQETASLKQKYQKRDFVVVTRPEVEEIEKDAFGFNLPSLPKFGRFFQNDTKSTFDDKQDKTAQSQSRRETSAASPAQTSADTSNSGIDAVTLTLKKTEKGPYKKTIFYFENGQIWKQTESRNIYIPKPRHSQTNTATIKKAAFGSYLLSIDGTKQSVRVKRVQ